MNKTFRTLAVVAMATVFVALTGCSKDPDLSNYVTRADYDSLMDKLNTLQSQLENNNNDNPDPQSINVTQTTRYDFNITFPAITDQYESVVTYNGLNGKMTANDVALVYIYSGDIDGAHTWCALPYCTGNEAITYQCTETGKLKFSYARAIHVTFTTESFSASVRVWILPQSVVATMQSSGIDLNSYDEVRAAVDVYQASL